MSRIEAGVDAQNNPIPILAACSDTGGRFVSDSLDTVAAALESLDLDGLKRLVA